MKPADMVLASLEYFAAALEHYYLLPLSPQDKLIVLGPLLSKTEKELDFDVDPPADDA